MSLTPHTAPPSDSDAFQRFFDGSGAVYLEPGYIRPDPYHRGDLAAVMRGAFQAGVEQGRAKERHDIVGQLLKTILPS